MMDVFEQLLARTSRTFALAIPLLAEPFRRELTLGYLLFRVADTLEDAEGSTRAARLAALDELRGAITAPDAAGHEALAAQWVRWRPTGHQGYLDLLAQFPALMRAIHELPQQAPRIVLHHARRTIEDMAHFVRGSDDDGTLRLATLDELVRYCYAVAGIVGEMITELFVAQFASLESAAAQLRAHAARFGEALQLVNIVRDANDDARHGRVYLPAGVPRAAVFARARESLEHAAAYIEVLERAGAGDGLIPFTQFPVMLARRTLELVERTGAGAKVSRDEVGAILLRAAGNR
jgi:farnesyl-diphosphate farnesyltransferase